MDKALQNLRRRVAIVNIAFLFVVAVLISLVFTNPAAIDFLFTERKVPAWLQEILLFFGIRSETNMIFTFVIWPVVLPMAYANAVYIARKRQYLIRAGLWEKEVKMAGRAKKNIFRIFLALSLINIAFIVFLFASLFSGGASNGDTFAVMFTVGLFTLLINVAITIISRIA